MKMKKKIRYVLAALVVAAGLASCDHIAEEDRLIYVPPVEVKKHVLIEDYTGQTCRNCPDATEAIHELQEVYGKSQVIAVGLYSGKFGQKIDGTLLPLTTETGNYYYTQAGVESQPSLNINRQGLTSDNAILKNRVTEALKDTTVVSIAESASYDSIAKRANINVNVLTTETLADCRLQVWLMEDSIVSPQVMPTGKTNKEYMHNHVFRMTVTDRDGKAISLDANQPKDENFVVQIPDGWVPEHLSIVAFVFGSDGVKQVEVIPLIAPETEIED